MHNFLEGLLQAEVQQPVFTQAVKWLRSAGGQSDSQRHFCGRDRHEGKNVTY